MPRSTHGYSLRLEVRIISRIDLRSVMTEALSSIFLGLEELG